LARIQQLMVLSSLVGLSIWAVLSWTWSPVLALTGVAVGCLGYTVVLALEFIAVARVNRRDTVPRAKTLTLLGAWAMEVLHAARVFFWRQPFCWRALSDSRTAGAAGSAPLVFVHGFVCNRGFWLPWMRTCRHVGLAYRSVNLEPVFGTIDAYVPLIEAAVRSAEALSARPPIIVCHSMGGLAVRAWMSNTPGAAPRIERVVTIGTPHHGTWLARFSRVSNGIQMRRRGDWLLELEAREGAQRPESTYGRFTCWYSNADNIVFPASTALLKGADNRHVPGQAHVALAFHPRVMAETLVMAQAVVRT
jgi:triacylglycerol lipase